MHIKDDIIIIIISNTNIEMFKLRDEKLYF